MDLVEIFLTSPPMSSVALDGPTCVDDDTVLLCADSPSQLIDKICEATRIYVDTARKFGLTLNCGVAKEDHWSLPTKLLYIKMVLSPLRFWDRCSLFASSRSTNMLVHGSPVLPLHSAILPTKSLAPPRGTCRQSAQSSLRNNTRGSYVSEPMQALVESRLLSNAGAWADVTLLQMAKLESVRSRVLRKNFEMFPRKRNVGER